MAAVFDGSGGFHGDMAMRGPTGGFGAMRFAATPSRTGFGGMSGGGFHHHRFHHHHFRNFVSFGIVAPMPMRIIRTMIATTWCGCERIMAGAGGVYLFAAELCDPGRARWKREQGRKRRRWQGNRLQGAALIHVREGVAHEQRSQLEQPAAYAYDFGDLCSCACGCDNRGVRNDDPSRRYETDQQRCATGNNRAGSSTSPARQRSGGSG